MADDKRRIKSFDSNVALQDMKKSLSALEYQTDIALLEVRITILIVGQSRVNDFRGKKGPVRVGV